MNTAIATDKTWICSDVWMDILPSFDHAQLGLKMALLSDRFDVLVDAHFDGKSELKLWNAIRICKDTEGPKPKLSVRIDDKSVDFPLPDRPLPNKIHFSCLRIDYIDHSVLTFLRSNKHIWDRNGIFWIYVQCRQNQKPTSSSQFGMFFARQIWPIFATNIYCLRFAGGHDHLDNLRRHISSTFLTDCTRLRYVFSDQLCPGVIADQFDDGQPNAATAGQMLSKWLHTPTKSGQPNQLLCYGRDGSAIVEWINNFKEIFLRATTTTSVSYIIRFGVLWPTTQIVPFELENERTKEKLTLMKKGEMYWLLKRCPIIFIGETAAVKWENDENLNNVLLNLWTGKNHHVGPLSPPAEEENKEEAGKSNENDV